MSINLQGMAKNPATGHRARRQLTCSGSYLERGMDGRKTVTGGELCVFRQKA